MTTEKALVKTTPLDIAQAGQEMATQLLNIIAHQPKKLVIGGKQYLNFEDWQTLGRFDGTTAMVTATEEITNQKGTLQGFKATAQAIKNGEPISAAEAECTFSESKWQTKPRFQLRSMAQTRACAKALRNCLGWIVVLAGFEPTPAEELIEVPREDAKLWDEESQAVPPNEEELLAWVCEVKGFKDHKTARSFLVNVKHVAPESLAKDPAGVFVELRGKI